MGDPGSPKHPQHPQLAHGIEEKGLLPPVVGWGQESASWPTHGIQPLPTWKEEPGVDSSEGEKEDSLREVAGQESPCVHQVGTRELSCSGV